ncbi:TPA: hypothetical protein ACGZ92_000445 [Elizabethkingia anophelis]
MLSEYTSIENAISSPWSNDSVEGFVNTLKTIKRQMYGRASFGLLRKRMILSSASPPKVRRTSLTGIYIFEL